MRNVEASWAVSDMGPCRSRCWRQPRMGPEFLRATIGLVLLMAAPVAPQTPPRARVTPADYFPLTVGNQWIYQQRGAGAGEPATVEVIGTAEYDGKTYYTLAGFIVGAPIQVRRTDAGDLVQY